MTGNQLLTHDGHLQVLPTNEVMHLSCVTFCYRGDSIPVLQSCSGVIHPGDVTILTGRNGSGKSTLCRLLAGVMSDAAGIMEGELTVAKTSESIIGYIGGDAAEQFVIGVVEDELAFGPENLGVPANEIDLRIERELTAIEMSAYRTARVEYLSGGQQQRIAAAAIWTMNPDILIVDDAWCSLDAEGRKQFTEALYGWYRASSHRTLIVSSSRPDELYLLHPLWEKATYWTLEDGVLHHSHRQWITNAQPMMDNHNQEFVLEHNTVRMSSRLVIDQVRVAYRNGAAPLQNISAVCQSGAGILLCGRNGSGKSTLLKLLCGYLRPQQGRIILNEQELHRLRDDELARLIGYVPQRAATCFLTGRVQDECMEVYRELGLNASSAESWCREQLQQLGLAECAKLHPHDLSSSAQRKLSLWIATVHQPCILLLDEPTAGLDEQAATEVIAWCQRERDRGVIVIAATHDPLWLSDHNWQHWTVAAGVMQDH